MSVHKSPLQNLVKSERVDDVMPPKAGLTTSVMVRCPHTVPLTIKSILWSLQLRELNTCKKFLKRELYSILEEIVYHFSAVPGTVSMPAITGPVLEA